MGFKKNTKDYPIHLVREGLRQNSVRQAEALRRSVGRLTSYDAQPCEEYRLEIDSQYAIAEELFYIQQCRDTLERCIASGAARLRYHWRDGRVTDTLFRKTTPARVEVVGLLMEPLLPAAG